MGVTPETPSGGGDTLGVTLRQVFGDGPARPRLGAANHCQGQALCLLTERMAYTEPPVLGTPVRHARGVPTLLLGNLARRCQIKGRNAGSKFSGKPAIAPTEPTSEVAVLQRAAPETGKSHIRITAPSGSASGERSDREAHPAQARRQPRRPGPVAAREADRRASALSTRERDRPAPPQHGEAGGWQDGSHHQAAISTTALPSPPIAALDPLRPVRISGPFGPVRHLLSTHQACPECEHHAGRPPRSNGHLAQALHWQFPLNAK